MQKRVWYGLGVTTVVFLLVLLLLPRQVKVVPAELEPFIKVLSFVKHQDGTEIGDVVDIPVNLGFYADLSFFPGESVPEQLEQLDVQDPTRWPMRIEIYSRRDPRKKNVMKHPFMSHDGWKSPSPMRGNQSVKAMKALEAIPPAERKPPLPMAGTGMWSKKRGYRGILEYPSTPREEGEIRQWTFLVIPEAQPGDEYVYEIVMFPTFQWISSVRPVQGEPVVIKRGLLRMTEALPNEDTSPNGHSNIGEEKKAIL